ncbi:MAG TPA: hypothetical protein VE776_13515 [Actinomycetota bacterium]|jgi:uncharacterized protein YcnI|nr:hypothetical protein [Actinomycetota bacterium]
MTRRIASVLAGALLLLAATVQAALAHEEINPPTVETGKPHFLTMTVANEKEAPITKVAITIPEGAEVGESTHSPAGWKAAVSGSTVTWSSGSLAPGAFEQFGFEIEQPAQPGTLTFTVAMTAGGDTEQAQVPLTVVAPGAAGQASAPSVTAGAQAAAAAGNSGDQSQGRATLALGVGVVGLLLGLVALGVALARRRSGAAAAGEKPVSQDF